MAKPINLNHFRKQKARQERAKKAEENRIKHGRTKAERQAERARQAKLARELAGKKLERPPESD